MSVYRDTNTSVTFEHPFEGPLVASVYRKGVKILESEPLSPTAGRFTLPLTYEETEFDGPLDIQWAGGTTEAPFLRTTTVDVITPLVPLSRLQTLFSDTNWSPTELSELENKVRIFIQSYTGQNYGYEIGSYVVTGTGETRVALPKRLIAATAISGAVPPAYYAVSDNGWYLHIRNKNWLTIKEVPPEEYVDNVQVVSGVIYVPDAYWNQFRRGARYTITGEWGYYSVPEDVQEAAMLLANDYACGDNLYRERYLDTVKAGEWNITHNPGAFRGTGNVTADKLLEPYRRRGMILI